MFYIKYIAGPIFKAGLFLFVSGIFSAGIVAAIISKANSWESLGNELDEGKMSQIDDVESKIEANVKKGGNFNELDSDKGDNINSLDL